MSKYKLLVRQPQGDSSGSIDVNINGKKTVIPFDKEIVVNAGIVEALEHAIEPYPVVHREEGKQVWTEVRQRPRFMFTATPIVEEKKESVPAEESESKRGRPKKEVNA